MTWSIIAKDAETRSFGIAITTKFFAVGGLTPYGAGRIGALATQGIVNPLYGTDGMALLAEGRDAEEVIAILTHPDPGAEVRQVHVVDEHGKTAGHTGERCEGWAGHICEDGVSVAGNTLAGEGVVTATLDAYKSNPDLPFAERLIVALEAGESEGGDKRGRQSAALRLWGAEPHPMLCIRVDDNEDPLKELRRLYDKSHDRFIPFMAALPTRFDLTGVIDPGEIEKRVDEHVSNRRMRALTDDGQEKVKSAD